MAVIDCSDCYLAIAVGDGVKRALVRHFRAFIAEALLARGIATASEERADRIDRDAWRLAARVITAVESEVEDTLDETVLSPDPDQVAQAIVAQAVAASVAAIEREYLQDALFGLEALADALGDATAPRESQPSRS